MLLLIIGGLFLNVAVAQDKDGLARVNKIQGVEVYFLSEPLREYEVVVKRSTGPKIGSLLTRGIINESPSDKASQFVKRLLRKANRKGYSVDAVVYSGGKRAVAVNFKEEANPENEGIGRIKMVKGIGAYVFSEPLAAYEVVNLKNGGLKFKSALTAGIINNSIEDDIEQFARRIKRDAKGDEKTIDSVIYSNGKSGIGIRHK